VKRDVMFERNFFALTNNIAPLPLYVLQLLFPCIKILWKNLKRRSLCMDFCPDFYLARETVLRHEILLSRVTVRLKHNTISIITKIPPQGSAYF